MITGYRHTGLVVRNLEKSLAFYEKAFGFTVWKRMVESGPFIETVVGIPGVVLEWVKLQSPDHALLELMQYHSGSVGDDGGAPRASNRLGCSHVAFTVQDIDNLYDSLIARRVHCNSPPRQSPDGMVKVLYCHDPDGIIIELVEECSKSSAFIEPDPEIN